MFHLLGRVDQTVFTVTKSLMGCSMSVCINSSLVERKRVIDGWRTGGWDYDQAPNWQQHLSVAMPVSSHRGPAASLTSLKVRCRAITRALLTRLASGSGPVRWTAPRQKFRPHKQSGKVAEYRRTFWKCCIIAFRCGGARTEELKRAVTGHRREDLGRQLYDVITVCVPQETRRVYSSKLNSEAWTSEVSGLHMSAVVWYYLINGPHPENLFWIISPYQLLIVGYKQMLGCLTVIVSADNL